jgi:cadmium resistance protein CadD (predicted permease)
VESVLEHLTLGSAVFAATNLDDLFLLLVWFADRSLPARAIVAGQLAGIAVLTGGSALLAYACWSLPAPWLALLGLLPLALGLLRLKSAWAVSSDGDLPDAAPAPGQGAPWLAVLLVTLANGADNLGVYVPLFAAQPDRLGPLSLLFLAGTLLWCLLAWALVRRTGAAGRWRAALGRCLPFVLIALGLWILGDVRQFWAGPA